MTRAARAAAAAMLLLAATGNATAQIANDQCLKCHDGMNLAAMEPSALAAMVRIPAGQSPVLRDKARVPALRVEEAPFAASVHAGLACVDCHRGVERLPHDQHLPVISCADCHTDAQQALAQGVHRPVEGNHRLRPDCSDCHGDAHTIAAVTQPRGYGLAVSMTRACMRCHDEATGEEPSPADSYRDNIHGEGLFQKGLAGSATCADCHGSHAILPPSAEESRLHPAHVMDTCGRCHTGVEEIYLGSVHGQHLLAGDMSAATCTSCHSSHGIGRVGEPFLLGVMQECSHCHIELAETYLMSYHGKAASLGEGSVAVCSSCHGAHDILPAADPASRVNEANLIQTCGQCHGNVNANFVKYIPHVDFTDPEGPPQVFWTWLIMTTMLLSVLAVFVPHGLLWFQRTLVERLRHPRGFHIAPASERRISRFSPIHRFTHALIIVSFMGLVLTGFPLKYSHTDWAHEMTRWLGGIRFMGHAHRFFAVLTFLYAAVHVTFLAWFFWKKCPRPRLKYLLGPDSTVFNLKDLKDAWAMLKWFFWLGPRPKFDRWAYFEKFDYWGEAWGVFLIGGTGLILWFPTFFTRFMPGWVLNSAMVIHSIEALLAASVIFLVHFFNTHLRPEKFPIDMVMLTGQMTESEMKEERPAEYERLVENGQLEGRVVPPVALRWRVVGAIFGMIAFSIGMVLIVFIIKTQLTHILGLK